MKFPEFNLKTNPCRLQVYSTLACLEGIASVIGLLLIPGDPKNAWLFGLSRARFGLLAGLVLATGVWMGMAIRSYRNQAWGKRLGLRLEAALKSEWMGVVVLLVGLTGAGGGLFVFLSIVTTPNEFLQAWGVRLAPLLGWGMLLCAQAVLFLRPFSAGLVEVEQRMQRQFTDYFDRLSGTGMPFRAGQARWRWGIDLPVVLGLIIIVLFVTRHIGIFVIDDAWISFRYSKNLAEGFGLTWEPASPERTEGYSNFLEVLAIALAMKLNLDPVRAAQGLGFISVVTLLLTSYLHLLLLTGQRVIALIPPLLFAVHPFAAVHTWASLETQMFAATSALLLLVFWLALRGGNDASARRLPFAVAGLGILTAFTRTEGLVLGFLALLTGLLVEWKSNRRRWLMAGVVFVGSTILYTLFRLVYFGALVTGPQLVKLSENILWGGLMSREFLDYAFIFLDDFPLAGLLLALTPILILFAIPLLRLESKSRSTLADWATLGLAGLQLGTLLFVYSRTTLVQNFASRFFMHIMPQMFILAGMAFALITRSWLQFLSEPKKFGPRTVALFLIVETLTLYTAGWFNTYRTTLNGFANFTDEYNQQQSSALTIAETLNAYESLHDEWFVTILDSGITPYFAGMNTLAGDGLTDLTLAALAPPRGNRAKPFAEYVYAHNPAVFMIELFGHKIDDAHAALLCDARFARYQLVAFVLRKNGGRYSVYLREDLPDFTALAQDFAALHDDQGRWKIVRLEEVSVPETCPYE